MNIDWSNRKAVINLAQSMANRSEAQIVYKVKQRSNYNICHACNWIRRLGEMERQGMVVVFVLTVEPAGAPIIISDDAPIAPRNGCKPH